MSGGLSRLQANANPWNLFPTHSLLAEQANPHKRLFLDTKKMERNIWPYNLLISLYFLRKNLCRFYGKNNTMKIKVFSASRKLLKGNAFFVQFPSELQFIFAQLHFPKLVEMINLYLFVFVYFKIRVSKFVLNQRAVGTQFLRLILSVGFWKFPMLSVQASLVSFFLFDDWK